MGEVLEILGIPDVVGWIDRAVQRVEEADRGAVGDLATVAMRQMQTNLTGPARWKDGVNYPREGGPGVVTGNLRRSVQMSGPTRLGFGSYTALVGPTAVYARALEYGNPRWHRQGGYPYVRPTLDFLTNVALNTVYLDSVRRAWLQP